MMRSVGGRPERRPRSKQRASAGRQEEEAKGVARSNVGKAICRLVQRMCDSERLACISQVSGAFG